MVLRRSYPRTPLERHGQVNWRTTGWKTPPFPVEKKEGPDCIFLVTKKKETFGQMDNKQSQSMSPDSADFMLDLFPHENFYRYKVNVYLK